MWRWHVRSILLSRCRSTEPSAFKSGDYVAPVDIVACWMLKDLVECAAVMTAEIRRLRSGSHRSSSVCEGSAGGPAEFPVEGRTPSTGPAGQEAVAPEAVSASSRASTASRTAYSASPIAEYAKSIA